MSVSRCHGVESCTNWGAFVLLNCHHQIQLGIDWFEILCCIFNASNRVVWIGGRVITLQTCACEQSKLWMVLRPVHLVSRYAREVGRLIMTEWVLHGMSRVAICQVLVSADVHPIILVGWGLATSGDTTCKRVLVLVTTGTQLSALKLSVAKPSKLTFSQTPWGQALSDCC